ALVERHRHARGGRVVRRTCAVPARGEHDRGQRASAHGVSESMCRLPGALELSTPSSAYVVASIVTKAPLHMRYSLLPSGLRESDQARLTLVNGVVPSAVVTPVAGSTACSCVIGSWSST